jgi:ribosomal protein S10
MDKKEEISKVRTADDIRNDIAEVKDEIGSNESLIKYYISQINDLDNVYEKKYKNIPDGIPRDSKEFFNASVSLRKQKTNDYNNYHKRIIGIINENKQLHFQLFRLDKEYDQEISRLDKLRNSNMPR